MGYSRMSSSVSRTICYREKENRKQRWFATLLYVACSLYVCKMLHFVICVYFDYMLISIRKVPSNLNYPNRKHTVEQP